MSFLAQATRVSSLAIPFKVDPAYAEYFPSFLTTQKPRPFGTNGILLDDEEYNQKQYVSLQNKILSKEDM
jgi:hypothetical protein